LHSKRFEKHNNKIPAHLGPVFVVRGADVNHILEDRPLSERIHFSVISVTPSAVGTDKKQFRFF
jgi:small subunit ribosomal protein S11e